MLHVLDPEVMCTNKYRKYIAFLGCCFQITQHINIAALLIFFVAFSFGSDM